MNTSALPWNVIFGAGALSRLPEELDKLGYSRALVLTTPNQAEIGQEIVGLLGDRAAGLFDRALMHVPVETLEQAMAEVKRLDADCSVSVGGGSTTGLSKALAFHLDLPNIVVPTSYAGSEMTNIWAVTQDDRKITRRDEVVVPTLTIYDPDTDPDAAACFCRRQRHERHGPGRRQCCRGRRQPDQRGHGPGRYSRLVTESARS